MQQERDHIYGEEAGCVLLLSDEIEACLLVMRALRCHLQLGLDVRVHRLTPYLYDVSSADSFCREQVVRINHLLLARPLRQHRPNHRHVSIYALQLRAGETGTRFGHIHVVVKVALVCHLCIQSHSEESHSLSYGRVHSKESLP